MRIGVITESEGESRVAIAPSSIRKLSKAGYEVAIQEGAGNLSNYSDKDYSDAGAIVVDREEALKSPFLICIRFPEGVDFFEGQVIACIADPFRHPERIKFCNSRKATLLSMDMIPRRLSRAQSM
ncbi:MAG: NAD(P)(+) transhydrogenase (Re/Si-specific) subunit alpha, partial [Candidatus Thermoplasmatota archaeon]|nr:NAD(P)(+) transhydrogenase (Re/Si-specific) subunit alpha [Candidatus Thermoplasmatota archaeon]